MEDELTNVMEEMSNVGFSSGNFTDILIRFLFNFIVIGIIIHFFYYPKSKRRDYYFTFMLINVSVFFLILLMGSVKLKIGFALGVFAIFGILRYRTEQVPIREMTYMFLIIALSVINALSEKLETPELIITNFVFLLVTGILESISWLKHTSCKLVMYDNIKLITPDKHQELLADLTTRTGLKIENVEVGYIDFLKDAAMLKVYYLGTSENSVDKITKLPKGSEI